MSPRRAGILAVFVLAPVAVFAATDTASKPVQARSRAGLVRPWSQMTTLTPEQREQIVAIHRQALEKIHAIQETESSDIWATLGDPQKEEYRRLVGTLAKLPGPPPGAPSPQPGAISAVSATPPPPPPPPRGGSQRRAASRPGATSHPTSAPTTLP